MTAKRTEKLDKAFAALLHTDDAKALAALAEINKHGTATAIFPLLHALAQTTDHARAQRIRDLLFTTKADGAAEELVRALDEPAFSGLRGTIVASFWNAGLDAAPHTERLIQLATEGTAEECFECLTVLENQEVLPEKAVLRGIKQVSKAIAANTDEYRGAMLGSLLVEMQARVGRDEPSASGVQGDLFS